MYDVVKRTSSSPATAAKIVQHQLDEKQNELACYFSPRKWLTRLRGEEPGSLFLYSVSDCWMC